MKDAGQPGEVERVLDQVEPMHVDPACVLLLDRGVVEVCEGIEPDDIVTRREQRLRKVRADEPGRSGDDVVHGVRQPTGGRTLPRRVAAWVLG